MSDELLIGLAGGAIGAALAVVFGQLGRAWIAWREVTLHDEDAAEQNAQLILWVDDRTRDVVRDMDRVTNSLDSGQVYSGSHGSQAASVKEDALHEYRDERARVSMSLGTLRARESGWHAWWRFWRRSKPPQLRVDTLEVVEVFLERWREPVTRHGDEAEVYSTARGARRFRRWPNCPASS